MSVDPTDPPVVAFEQATYSDAVEVAALVQSAYRGDASREGWTTEADFLEGQRVDEAMVREVLNDPDAIILTARMDGRLVGCCELRVHHPDEAHPVGPEHDSAGDSSERDRVAPTSALPGAYLGMFAVEPTLQASGMGRRILAEAEARVRDRWSARRLVITVISVRTELIEWYHRRGFRLTGTTSPFPYEDQRFGVPLRDDLEFVELEKLL